MRGSLLAFRALARRDAMHRGVTLFWSVALGTWREEDGCIVLLDPAAAPSGVKVQVLAAAQRLMHDFRAEAEAASKARSKSGAESPAADGWAADSIMSGIAVVPAPPAAAPPAPATTDTDVEEPPGGSACTDGFAGPAGELASTAVCFDKLVFSITFTWRGGCTDAQSVSDEMQRWATQHTGRIFDASPAARDGAAEAKAVGVLVFETARPLLHDGEVEETRRLLSAGSAGS